MNDVKSSIAILDMNNGQPNQGLRCITEIVNTFREEVESKVFDVRSKSELPDLDYDIYISSGGPGSPLEEGEWKDKFCKWLQSIWHHNATEKNKKFLFLICHSFQMAIQYFKLGQITKRKRTSFGIYPIHKEFQGRSDRLLAELPDPYYAVDSRDWQIIQPNLEVFAQEGCQILSLEKIRTNIELERAIMAVRFSEEIVGTQFHPEADPTGMKRHFTDKQNQEKVIKNFGKEKYDKMMEQLDDPDKISMTYNHIIPGFIRRALDRINEYKPVAIL